ncbi:MAG: hypothetical protein GX938_06445 [Spirochaetales bacterium]|nr:hypothetical protein [Spirochaetales bacterium]
MQRGFLTRNWVLSYILGALVVILGVFLLFQQESFIKFFVVMLGLFVLISGLVQLFSLSSYKLGPLFHKATLIRSIVSVVAGFGAIILPLTVAKISWTLLLYSLAVIFALSALINLLNTAFTAKAGGFRAALAFDGVFSLVMAILLFAFPEQIGTVLLKLVGIVIILAGLSIVVLGSRGRSLAKRPERQVLEGEAEVID